MSVTFVTRRDPRIVSVRVDDGRVLLQISDARRGCGASLTAEETDELIRALGLARVEISKARPQS